MKPVAFFRDWRDLRPVGIIVVNVALSLLPFIFDMSGWQMAVCWGAMAYSRTFTAFAQHNHGHLPVFSLKPLNNVYDVLLTQCTGYPTSLWELHHVRGHHRHYLRPAEDVAAIVDRKTGRKMSRVWYAMRGNLRIHFDSVRIGLTERRAGKKSLLGKLAGETVVQMTIIVLLFIWNPGLTLAFFVIPAIANAFAIWWESYPHHLDVPQHDTYDGSVTILDRVYNFVTFNIGHHTAHHEKPTLHWALLPLRTQAIRDRIPDACVRERRSLTA